MSEARVNNLSNESNTGGPTISGISTFSGTNFFVPPVGNTEQRPDNPQKGALRFNTDTKHLEYFKGDTIGWSEIEASNDELNGGNRGLFGAGQTPTNQDVIDYIAISTLANAVDFGNLVSATSLAATASSRTRGVWAGGYAPNNSTKTDKIDYVTISSTGDAADFGNLLAARMGNWGLGSQIRGVFGQGKAPSSEDNVIQYITIASIGNAVDFGDATAVGYVGAALASSTRGCFAMGISGAPTRVKTINYLTIATLGNSADFGDLTTARMPSGTGSNAVRGIWGGGETASAGTNTIDFITIATTGNAQDFGDATYTNANNQAGGLASPTRVVFGGGATPAGGNRDDMCYVETMTTGNAVDFGNLSVARMYAAGLSNGHGGL